MQLREAQGHCEEEGEGIRGGPAPKGLVSARWLPVPSFPAPLLPKPTLAKRPKQSLARLKPLIPLQ